MATETLQTSAEESHPNTVHRTGQTESPIQNGIRDSNSEQQYRSSITVEVKSRSYDIEQGAILLAGAFIDDPVWQYILNHLSDSKQSKARRKILNVLSHLALSNSAIFLEVSLPPTNGSPQASQGPQSITILTRPRKHLDEVGVAAYISAIPNGVLGMLWTVGITRFLKTQTEVVGKVGAVQKRYFSRETNPALPSYFSHPQDYYYVDFIGTAVASQGRGLGAAAMEKMKQIAREDVDEQGRGKPIWLEASSRASRRLYARCGWRDVEKLVHGVGKCDSEGRPASGEKAVGVEMFAMVWWPEGCWPEDKAAE